MKICVSHGISLLCGLLFGIGMILSQMVNPVKVIGFLDVTGNWDTTLLFVMLGALSVFMPVYWFVIRIRQRPLIAQTFSFSSLKHIDVKLVTGATIFGIGWGIAGICPGPALSRITFGDVNLWLFFVSMLLGLFLTQKVFK